MDIVQNQYFQQRRSITAILLLLFMFSLPAVGGEVKVKKLYNDDWISIESDNFDVLSNASKKQTILMIEDLENFNFFVSKLLGYKQKTLARKVPVILAKGRSSFLSMGMPNDIAGVFTSVEGGVIFARADKFRSSTAGASWGRSVVLHELTHLLMNNSEIEWATPPWYREGIAEYLGTYVRKKNKIVLGDLSTLQNRFYSVIKRGGGKFENVDSESLFKVVQEDLGVGKKKTRAQDRFVTKFYTRSLSVTHYLNADPQRRRQLYQYLSLRGKGYGIDESFEHVFKMSYKEFDALVNSYIDGNSVLARVFDISDNGIVFPSVSTQINEISNTQVLMFLYSNISLFSDGFLGEGEREKMEQEIEAIIPDFFAD